MGVITQREKRIGLHLTVDVSGEDAAGTRFSESAVTRNISGGGICFESHRRLIVGLPLVLQIQLPPVLRKHFGGRSVYRARAVVCRVENFEGEESSRVGARFLGEVE
ncbi:MAG TPA: PilZ domain-containing protein [Vicinamibacteria bacterium]|jgi:hypothetical protein